MTKDFSKNSDIWAEGDQRSKAALLGFSSDKSRGGASILRQKVSGMGTLPSLKFF